MPTDTCSSLQARWQGPRRRQPDSQPNTPTYATGAQLYIAKFSRGADFQSQQMLVVHTWWGPYTLLPRVTIIGILYEV